MSSVLSYSHYTISQTKDNLKVSETHWFHTAGTGCFFFSTLACSFSVCIKIHHLNNKRDNDYINIYYKIINHYTTVTTIILPKLCYSLVSITRKFLLFRNNTSCDENSGRSIPHGGHFLIEKDKDTSAFQGTNERLYEHILASAFKKHDAFKNSEQKQISSQCAFTYERYSGAYLRATQRICGPEIHRSAAR
ncbi:unnamed protein product [Cladocopium goreaui]|uniref:Uncharacterized protein n=1 Tax=Cladocopium goreaui TaxID=2562237 RepID=A0A9P1FY73_9DINO|nr:unnamed protein product [Cladocopium goreaui]